MKSRAQRTAFVTGATGFVGSFLVDRLLHDGWNVVALVRGGDAMERVCAALKNVRGLSGATFRPDPGLRVLSGNVRDPFLGLDENAAMTLAGEIDAVWHCAANFKSDAAGENPFSVNVAGTQHLLAFTARCNRVRPVPFFYVSTAFAADCRDGLAREEASAPGGGARNDYESSKRAAERLVLDWQSEHAFPAAVFRPSIILGHAHTGRAAGFAAYYDFLRSLCRFAQIRRSHARRERPDAALRVRTRPDLRVNLVTIDFVIDAMCALAGAARGDDSIFNIVNEVPVAAGVAIDVMCRSIGLTGVELADEAAFATTPMTRSERLFHSMIGFERPYLEQEVLFDNSRFRRIVPANVLPAPCIDAPLLGRINRGYLEHCEREAGETLASQRILPLTSGSLAAAAN